MVNILQTMTMMGVAEEQRDDWYKTLVQGKHYPEHGGQFISLYTPLPTGKEQEVHALFLAPTQYTMALNEIIGIPEFSKLGSTVTDNDNVGLMLGAMNNSPVDPYAQDLRWFKADGNTGLNFGSFMKSKIPKLATLPFNDYYIPSVDEIGIIYAGSSHTTFANTGIPANDVSKSPKYNVFEYLVSNLGSRVEQTRLYYASPSSTVRLVRRKYCYTRVGSDPSTTSADEMVFVYGNEPTTPLIVSSSTIGTILQGSGVVGTLTEKMKSDDCITMSFNIQGYQGGNYGFPTMQISPYGYATPSILQGAAVTISKTGASSYFIPTAGPLVQAPSELTLDLSKSGMYGDSSARRDSHYTITLDKVGKFIECTIHDDFGVHYKRWDATAILLNLGSTKPNWWIGVLGTAGGGYNTYTLKNFIVTSSKHHNRRIRSVSISTNSDNNIQAERLNAPLNCRRFLGINLNTNGSGNLNTTYLSQLTSGGETYIGQGARFKADGSRGRGTVFQCIFRSTSYFTNLNMEHIAIGIRGNIIKPDLTPALTGKGVVLGNVSGYPASGGVCDPTDIPNAVAAESFYEGGNCVYGSKRSPVVPTNSRSYRLTIVCDDIDKTIHFSVEATPAPYGGTHKNTLFRPLFYHMLKIDDVYYDNSEADDYWFVGTDVKNRAWDFDIYSAHCYNYHEKLRYDTYL